MCRVRSLFSATAKTIRIGAKVTCLDYDQRIFQGAPCICRWSSPFADAPLAKIPVILRALRHVERHNGPAEPTAEVDYPMPSTTNPPTKLAISARTRGFIRAELSASLL